MKAKKAILISVSAFFLIGLVYFSWQLWEKRYDYFFQGGELENVQEEESSDRPTWSPSPAWSPSPSSVSEELSEEEKEIQDILENHCDQNCRRKTEVAEKKYCLEICGLNLPEEISDQEACEKLSGQEGDICWKNLAVSKKDAAYCDKIKDIGIKESCQNRLVEEFLN